MTVTHPVALRDARTHPGGYTHGTTTYRIDSEGVIQCPSEVAEDVAETLADQYDEDVEDLLEDTASETTDDVEAGDTVCSCGVDDACDTCGGQCPTVKSDGDVCGRDRPCSYHDNDDDDGED